MDGKLFLFLRGGSELEGEKGIGIQSSTAWKVWLVSVMFCRGCNEASFNNDADEGTEEVHSGVNSERTDCE